MKRMTALYARVSGDLQKEEGTIASQRAALLEYIQAHELTVPPEWIFEDDGYSGDVLARPGLERLRDLVAQGQVEVVLVHEPGRLSRKYAYQVLLMEEFSRGGAETLFVKSVAAQTPEERLLVQFQGMIAEYERAQIMERTRRGKRYRAKAGGVGGLSTAAYGYRYERKTEQSQPYLLVHEAEAQVVRRIFELYTQERWSVRRIAEQLNQEQVPTRSGRVPWQPSTLWGILSNSAYQGRAYYGKTRACPRQRLTKASRQKGGFSHRRHASHQPVEPAQWIEIAVPALVSPELFALAQERLAEGRRLSPRNTKQPSLLQGVLVCAHCGYGLSRSSALHGQKRHHYYRCGGADAYRRPHGAVCSLKALRVDYLDNLVWEQILQLLRRPELIQAELERRRQESLQHSPVQQRQEQLEREVSRLRQQADKLLDAYQEGLLSLAQLRQRMPELRKKLGAAEQQLQSLAVQLIEDQRWHELNNSIESFLGRLNQTAQTLNVAERQKIVRLLIKQIDVSQDTITIHHAIPLERATALKKSESSQLCTAHLLARPCA